ncbi:GNAT family N-acetyltransferase [Nocardia sp. CWNU-33]|uniref:GNAT family N-acetyltransferase n=1 Tax=Nocardia sp. CWNU-33 TaxID=3392117 RepID=UPI00398E4F59
MKIREYHERDKDECLRIFVSNMPEFFAPHEISEFDTFLDNPRCSYHVIEENGVVVACGGWVLRPDRSSSLCWGMVSRSHHRRGIGAYLLHERLHLIAADGSASCVLLETSQRSSPFFERLGFVTTQTERDGFAPGIDAVAMRLDIASRDVP